MRIAQIDIPVDAPSALPHAASIGAIVSTIMGWLPGIVALVPAIYYSLLIYESKTVQRALKRRRLRKLAQRLHRKKTKRSGPAG